MNKIKEKAFTLIEVVLTISIISIISVGVATFIRPLIDSFVDVDRRAEKSSQIESAALMMKREIRSSLPNSVRVLKVGSLSYIEFIPLKTVGRYRAETSNVVSAAPCSIDNPLLQDNDILDFSSADKCLKTIGLLDTSKFLINDYLAVFNLGQGYSDADAYEFPGTGGNKSKITNFNTLATETSISFEPIQLKFQSNGNRLFIIGTPISYLCDETTKRIVRFSNYSFNKNQTTDFSGATSSMLLENISTCNFIYNNNIINQRNGVLSMHISLNNEDNISIYNEIQIPNTP